MVSLCFSHPITLSLCRQDRRKLLDAEVWVQAPLVCLTSVPLPLRGLRELLVLSSTECSHCSSTIPSTTIVLLPLVRYKGIYGDERLYTSVTYLLRGRLSVFPNQYKQVIIHSPMMNQTTFLTRQNQ